MIANAKVLKFAIVGDGGAGKTTLSKVFCNNAYIDQIMTIGIDIHAKDVIVDGERTVLQIWDISGQDQFKFLLPTFIGGASGVILAYDSTRYSSFLHLNSWLHEVWAVERNAPVFLISTKADLAPDPEINPEKAKEFVREHNLLGFIETSAKISLNVNTPFKRLIEQFFKFEADQVPIIFLGPEEEFRKDLTPESPWTTPVEILTTASTSQTHHTTQQISDTEDKPPLDRSIEYCSFCNSPLRQSQIKMKQAGESVLCHHCFNQT